MTKKQKPKRRRQRPAQLQMSDLPELRQARALWQKNRLLEALALFEKTVRAYPFHGMALADASRALGAFYRIQEAETLLNRLVELAKGNADVLQLAGQSYRLIRRPEAAIECFRNALLRNDRLSDSHLELALLLERRNELDQAMDHIDARLRLIPGDNESRMLKGRLLRRMGETASSETSLRAVCETSDIFWMTQARAWSELATLLDEQGRYDDAWEAMLAAKKSAIPFSRSARSHRDRIVPRLNDLAMAIDGETTSDWQGREQPSLPPIALLSGLPRSGTTLLETMLDSHPQIVSCDEFDAFPGFIFPALLGKTPLEQFGVGCLNEQTDKQLEKLGESYVRFLTEALGEPVDGRCLLDKNPSLLLLIPAYFRLLSSCRLLVVLRDPRDLLISCLMTYFPLNDFSVDFLELKSGAERIVSDLNVWFRLREVLPANWGEVRYEELVSSTKPTLEAALSTLGLRWVDEVGQRPVNRHISAPSYEQISQPVYSSSVGRWRNYERQIDPALKILDPLISALGY